MMSFKICVLLIAIFLFQSGQPIRFFNDANEKISENTVRRIQNVFIKRYPQAAIDKYISVVRQLYSQNPEEKKAGNFESMVLMVEGALYQTEIQREMLSHSLLKYDVRSALKRIEDADLSDSDELTEHTIEMAMKDLAKEFPSEVGETIGNILRRILSATTLDEAKKTAIDLTILSMDGAKVITNRMEMLQTQTI